MASKFAQKVHMSIRVAIALVLSLTAVAFAQDFTFRLGHAAPVNQPTEAAVQNLADRVAARSGGRLVIRSFPASQLGSVSDMWEQVQQGSLQLTIVPPSFVARAVPGFNIFDAPFVFDDVEHVREFARSSVTQGFASDLLEQTGVRILEASPIFGPRHLSTRATPVRSPADLAGLKIRVHDSQARVDTIRAWGASPVVTPTAEMYVAMQTGLADGQESPLAWQAGNRFWEVQSFVSLTSHFIQNDMLVANERALANLPDDLRTILMEEVIAYADEITSLYETANEEAMSELERHGMTIISDIDRDAFREATEEMWQKWEDSWGPGLQDRVLRRDYVTMDGVVWQAY